MIPGSNLLADAFSVIDSQTFGFKKFVGRAVNDIGIQIPTYDDEITYEGSIQAVPRALFQNLGLDWKKNYIMIYSVELMAGISRGTSGDKVNFMGKTFLVLSENDWQSIDGWAGVLCVEVFE